MAHICPGWPGWPPRFLIERITETKEGNEDEMFPDGRDERNISGENENIWKNIPGEKLPKFAGRNGGNILLAGFNGWEQLGGRWKEMTPV